MSDPIDNNEKQKSNINFNINELSHLLDQIKKLQKTSSEINQNINKITNIFFNLKQSNDYSEVPEDFGSINDNSVFFLKI